MEDSVITKTGIQELAKKDGMRVGEEAYDAINKLVVEMVKRGFERAKANNRKTLQACDI